MDKNLKKNNLKFETKIENKKRPGGGVDAVSLSLQVRRSPLGGGVGRGASSSFSAAAGVLQGNHHNINDRTNDSPEQQQQQQPIAVEGAGGGPSAAAAVAAAAPTTITPPRLPHPSTMPVNSNNHLGVLETSSSSSSRPYTMEAILERHQNRLATINNNNAAAIESYVSSITTLSAHLRAPTDNLRQSVAEFHEANNRYERLLAQHNLVLVCSFFVCFCRY